MIKEILAGLTACFLIASITVLGINQLASSKPSYMPTQSQILHLCDVMKGEELEECLMAANKAEK